MIKKTITFEDLEGNPRTEDFWFHLNKAELAELKMIHGDGLEGIIGTLNAAKNGETIVAAFRKIISSTVGVKNEDGVSFDKPAEYVKRFMNSDAYSVLFMELIEGEDSGADFVIGILPKDIQDEARKQKAEAAKSAGSEPWITENREPTKAELASMSKEQMFRVMERRTASA